jgi:hypothetical protein
VLLPVAGFFIHKSWHQRKENMKQNAILMDRIHSDGVAARIEQLSKEAFTPEPDGEIQEILI